MPYYRCPECGLTSYSVAGYSTVGVCAACAAPLPAHQRLHPAPQADSAEAVRAGIAAPAQARHMITTPPLHEEARYALMVVVSELVTNSVRHSGAAAGDPIEIRVKEDGGQLSVLVRHGGPGFSQRTATNGGRRLGGRGLKLVGALTKDWKVECGPDGCTVRALIDTSATAPTRTNARQNGELRLEEGAG